MFLLSLFGKTKPYSCLANAKRESSLWLYKHNVPNYWLLDGPGCTPALRKDFEDALKREDYHTCVCVWNKYIDDYYCGEAVRKAVIVEVNLDEPFSDR